MTMTHAFTQPARQSELLSTISPTCMVASYTEQLLPQYKGNPLIEALPRTLTDDELYNVLALRPDFSTEQRQWPVESRIHMLQTLQNFMVPMSMHFGLSRALDSMLRAGYVARAPHTHDDVRRFQAIYDSQKNGVPFRQTAKTKNAQISSLLMGLSGMGKTTTVKRWFSHIPRVIHHPALHIFQVPYLHVEMPSDGSSIKGLAHAILQQVDQLVPGANYYELYACRGRTGADALMRSVARVLNTHYVGFIVADEIQNLANAKKGGQTVMTELVSACNELGVPILFIGTNKAAKVFSLDFRQSRRASGHGIEPWDRLPSIVDDEEPDDWRGFINELWEFQWVQNPVELDELLLQVMYHCSQGVIDIAIKLFAACQARAMLDGTERVTPELIVDVYDRELKLLHPMVEALRDDDLERLSQFEDIAPVSLTDLMANAQRKARAKTSKAFSVKSTDPTFVPRLAASLALGGMNATDAEDLATGIQLAGKAKNLREGVEAARAAIAPPRRLTKLKVGATPQNQVNESFDDAADYRRAVAESMACKVPAHQKFHSLGMTAFLDQLLDLS